MLRSKKYHRIISVFLLIVFLNSIFSPTVSYALTSGPAQPEFSSFEPVSSSNMVDLFTGDFTYNLPVLEVPGPHGSSYPISLSYHSGVTPEEEASWVGYGWTLNAGAINRNTRGVPDDHNGQNVTFHNTMPKNWTASVGGGVGFGEVFGADLKGISANGSIRYNNYRGFGYNAGIGVSLGRGLVSMGYNVSDGTGSFSLNVNPFAILNYTEQTTKKKIIGSVDRYLDKGFYKGFKKRPWAQFGGSLNVIGSNFGYLSYTEVVKPNIVHQYSGQSFNVSIGLTGNVGPVPVGGSVNTWGTYAYQTNAAAQSVPSFGYLYSAQAYDQPEEKSLMDYHVEHEGDFNPRDHFLGVPFNDADNFMVSGEGLGGGFRLYNQKAGHYGPRPVESTVDIFNVGGDIGAGWTFGPGIDVGKGDSKLSVSDWSKLSSFEDPYKQEPVDEAAFFRFTGDLGGQWGDVHNDLPIQASFSGDLPALSPELFTYNTGNKRAGRSSYIGYHLNKDMLYGSSPSKAAYSKITAVNAMAGRTYIERRNLIGEIAVFNGGGMQYNYGLPVYSRSESSLNYSVRGLTISDNYLAYPTSLNSEVKIGEERNSQSVYASTYLLTEILTPDYVDYGDVTGMSDNGEWGASPDDAGAYTRFNYQNVFSLGSGDWYDWRMPYRGLLYNRGSLSDPLDDTGGYSEGEKELYFLHSIETKTHVALFYASDRSDGREAPSSAWTSGTATGTQGQKQLDKIELYTIQDFKKIAGTSQLQRTSFGSPILEDTPAKPKAIKTIYFQYDNTLDQGVMNFNAVSGAVGTGKLTLKRVYTQYNEIEKTNGSGVRISPYEFSYSYPDYLNTYPDDYKPGGTYDVAVGYKDLTYSIGSSTNSDQNPLYDKFASDPWGNYQPNGQGRFSNMRPWVDQSLKSNTNGFDPAAWHLKRITLPSGGQIHVQYEQDDYSYVQNQQAHAMVTLKIPPTTQSDGTYLLDLSSLGLVSGVPADELVADDILRMIRERYISGGKKMYFKILYSLVTDVQPNLSTCNADFITGYASVSGASRTSDGIYVTFTGAHGLPSKVCTDFVKAQRLGKVVPGSNCAGVTGLSDGSDAKGVVMALWNMAQNIVVPEMCKQFNPSYSALRVPIPIKKGGGVRVKRLLTYTTSLDGAKVLYGNEYVYKIKDGNRLISSGVATNEPQSIREENILTDFVARKNQTLWSKIVAGRDKDQAEGPIGESILPAPSVGYSKVVVKNIHSGKSDPGFSVNEFNTAKEWPIKLGDPDDLERDKTMTNISLVTPDRKSFTTPFYTEVKNSTRATQGFSFVLNSMHGQPKRVAAYGGTYDPNNETKTAEVSSTEYTYYKPGETVPVMSSVYGGVVQKNPGREVDITYAQRKVVEKQKDVNVEGDLQITIIPLFIIILVIPYPTAIPSFSNIEGELSTHMTSKVVRYPALVKQIKTSQDGIDHLEENLAFDENSGQPVAVRSGDEFKGAYLTQSIPAAWEYKNMGGKWKNENKRFTGGFYWGNNTLAISGTSCTLAEFSPGDKIRVGDYSSNFYCQVVSLDYLNNRLNVEPLFHGYANTGTASEITIVASGRTNQLQSQAGSITAHNESKDALTPITVDQASRYETATNSFITDLKNATQSLTGNGTAGTFTLAGPYTEMDLSAFADKLQSCAHDLTKIRAKNLEYRWSVANGQLTLDLMAFEAECVESPSTWTPVAAEGWQ